MSAELSKPPKRARRWLQYSLRNFVLLVSAVCIVLGVFRHFAARPTYEARVRLSFSKPGNEPWSPQEMYALERLATSPRVLEGAINQLSRLSGDLHKVRVNLLPTVRAGSAELRSRLMSRSVSDDQGMPSGVVEIAYRSQDPRAAEIVMIAVCVWYMEILEELLEPKLCDDPRYRFLMSEYRDFLRQPKAKKHRLQEPEEQAWVLGWEEDGSVANRDLGHVRRWVEAVAAVRQEAGQLEAVLTELQAARRRGRDVWQYLPALEPIVLDDARTEGLGPPTVDSREAAVHAAVERKLLKVLAMQLVAMPLVLWREEPVYEDVERQLREDRTRLGSLLKHYGEQHPAVLECLSTIRNAEDWLNKSNDEHRKRLADRWALLPAGQSTAMLVQKAEERLETLKELDPTSPDQYLKADAESGLRWEYMAAVKDREQAVEFLSRWRLGLMGRVNDSLDRPRVCVALLSAPKAVRREVNFRVILWLVLGLGLGLALVHVWDRWPRSAARPRSALPPEEGFPGGHQT